MGILNEHQLKFNSIKDAKQLLEAVEKRFGRNAATKKTQRNLLKQRFENFSAPSLEMLDQTFDWLQKLVSQLEILVNAAFFTNFDNLSDDVICAFLASQPNSRQLAHEDLEQIYPDDMKEMDLIWQMAMLTIRAKRFLKKTGKKLTVNGNETLGFDMSKVECYNYHKKGHFARECRAPRNQDNKHKESTKRSVPVKTPASRALVSCDGLDGYDWRNFMPPKSDLSYTSLDELANKTVSDDEEENMTQPKIVKKTVRPSIVKKEFVKPRQQEKTARKTVKKVEHNRQNTHRPRGNQRNWNNTKSQKLGSNFKMYKKACYECGSFDHLQVDCYYHQKQFKNQRMVKPIWNNAQRGNPQMDLHDQRVIDSGCSRHMIENMSYITDYEEIDGGYVAFGGNPKGWKITRKEAVNIAWYVQNRVLVVKPHNRTPYKLFYGRPSTLSFMRQFGCLVTTLNTKDHLGKVNGKVDEGFFVGYSLNSKAFRVFNSRTRIVEENLHIRFSENTHNVVGSGPDWLFDIDALTRTMNYEPIIAGTQSNGFAGTKVSDNAGQARKEAEPVKDYILLPLWTDPRKENECNDQDKEDNVNSTNNVNTVSLTVNAAGPNEVNELPFEPNMPALEDVSILNFSNDDEDDDIVADKNNMDTTIQVSLIPTTKIHKDYPLDQVIRDLHSATQTRQMSKNLEEHGFVLNGFSRTKKDERKIVIRYKARLVAQGHTQEEMSDNNEVFTPVARIEAIRLFFAYILCKDFAVYQMDVKSVFLYGKIKEEVYVCQPLGFEDPNFPNRVYKVDKALYGLHQAPKVGYETLSTYLLDNGFQRGKIDKTLFIKRHKEVKNASKPMKTQKPLLKDEDGEEVDVHMYRSMIGSLMYLTSSRPKIMFVVCACARYQVNPKDSHLHAVKRNLAYTDSDYARAILNRKSTTGGCQILGCRLISWQCKKHTVVANSTTKSTAMAKTINGEAQIHAWVDGKEITITESSVRRDLLLADEEDSTLPTDPQHTPTILQSSSSQPQNTQVPQPSGFTENIADEVVHKEWSDRLVRAATTASSLEAVQDNGGSPRCQDTIEDTIAQTRFEIVSKLSNDSLLAKGNTLQSDEDIMKLNELMELCTNLQLRVLELEKTKTTQANEIDSLKRRARVDSSKDEQSLGEDASKQERKINDIEADEDITLVNDQDDAKMFDVNNLHGEEVFVEKKVTDKEANDKVQKVAEDTNTAKVIVDAAQVSVAGEVNAASIATTVSAAAIITIEEITLARALVEIKTTKPKAKEIVLQEPIESPTTTTTIPKQKSLDKGKGIMVEEPVKHKKKDQIRLDEGAALKLQAELQAEFDEEQRLARERAEKELEANIAFIETWDDVQAKIDDDHQLAERLQAEE
uniref:CCHC-type domain-containing protein n=1 Tax=Tanacetum cinerariifolium TaxID=118510 RepID=A0A6L2L709_TANCI|nr:hypothetical protein [Tanacetum cinerariifolium]